MPAQQRTAPSTIALRWLAAAGGGLMPALGVFAVHVAAAFKRQFVDRDDTLFRMLPRRDRTPEAARR